ncbi:hypothetical protein [Sphingomonas sp. J315]|uniref:hypothetical protein n=1 Tax=Sphingomonas sp. J315 TaxID=2898433 RepID=UPI0021AD7CA8|nr:hypothetical protein [Sphingomonas sp. J315]UUY00718.1 hypothetical protein LRS08_06475 [Sphingomonas sp. J315]
MARPDRAAARAEFYAPEIAFDRPVPKVPAAAFRAERDRAFAADAATGSIPCDLSGQLGSPWPATTPTMLARYVVIRAGETLQHQHCSTGEVFYVMRGAGERCAGPNNLRGSAAMHSACPAVSRSSIWQRRMRSCCR